MTTIAPVQCLGCSRLDRSITDRYGAVIPARCAAYPEQIPAEIATFGEDHRKPIGDERDGLVFASAEDSVDLFDAWRRFAGVATEPVEAKYNPAEPRDPGGEGGGQWVSGPAGKVAGAVKDALKLAGKIDLEPDEKLIGSAKVNGDSGIRMALIDRGGRRILRLGAGGEGYGQPDREAGIPAWDGNPSPSPLTKAERDRLRAESDALNEEYDTASPARQAEIDARADAIHEQLTVDDIGFNGTAELDEHGMRQVAERIRPALAEAVAREKAGNAAWDELEALQKKANPDPARLAELQQATAGLFGLTFAEGTVPGSAWGDVHFMVGMEDVPTGPYLLLGVQPKGAPDDWGYGRDWMGTFDVAETRKFLRLLDQFTKGVQAAAGVDTHPGGEHLRHYWLHGEGVGKWSTWTELYHHLVKYLSPDMAKRTAAEWFHERYGDWPGSDTNRVRHGKHPRGSVVGPG
jgi:hypothetical protein